MQTTHTQTNKNIAFADSSSRMLAFALDVVVLFILIGITDFFTFSSDEQALLLKPERFLHFLLGWIYFAGAEICPCQATLGKYHFGLKVTDTTGSRLTFKQASIRYFAKPLTLFILFFRFITGTSYSTQTTFHDRMANARVISK